MPHRCEVLQEQLQGLTEGWSVSTVFIRTKSRNSWLSFTDMRSRRSWSEAGSRSGREYRSVKR